MHLHLGKWETNNKREREGVHEDVSVVWCLGRPHHWLNQWARVQLGLLYNKHIMRWYGHANGFYIKYFICQCLMFKCHSRCTIPVCSWSKGEDWAENHREAASESTSLWIFKVGIVILRLDVAVTQALKFPESESVRIDWVSESGFHRAFNSWHVGVPHPTSRLALISLFLFWNTQIALQLVTQKFPSGRVAILSLCLHSPRLAHNLRVGSRHCPPPLRKCPSRRSLRRSKLPWPSSSSIPSSLHQKKCISRRNASQYYLWLDLEREAARRWAVGRDWDRNAIAPQELGLWWQCAPGVLWASGTETSRRKELSEGGGYPSSRLKDCRGKHRSHSPGSRYRAVIFCGDLTLRLDTRHRLCLSLRHLCFKNLSFSRTTRLQIN